MKKHIFAILLLASSAQSGVNAIPSDESASKTEASSLNSTHNAGPAEFVAYKFITKHKEKTAQISGIYRLLLRAASIPVGGGVGFVAGAAAPLTGAILLYIRSFHGDKNYSSSIICSCTGLALGGIAALYGAIKAPIFVKKRMKRNIERSILKEFLSNWNQYQNDTPVELHGYFDTLAEEYQKDWNALRKNAVQINKEIRQKIQPLRFRTQ
jgi:hypothetical protein